MKGLWQIVQPDETFFHTWKLEIRIAYDIMKPDTIRPPTSPELSEEDTRIADRLNWRWMSWL
jgi:hypothetical protein